MDWRLKTIEEAARKEKTKEKRIQKTLKSITNGNSEDYTVAKTQMNELIAKVESTIDSMANYINKEATGDDW